MLILKMTSRLSKNIYQHLKTKNLYSVVGIGRRVETPDQEVVIYQQLYPSTLKGSNPVKVLPEGYLWVREYQDFSSKFVKFTNTENNRK